MGKVVVLSQLDLKNLSFKIQLVSSSHDEDVTTKRATKLRPATKLYYFLVNLALCHYQVKSRFNFLRSLKMFS